MGVAACVLAAGCAPYATRHAIHWDARAEIWQAEESQVRLRSAQSRVFDTNDRRRALEAVVATFQDLGFQIEVLDEALGIVSGKAFASVVKPSALGAGFDTSYFLYDEESLVVFSKAFRSWGPFWHRSNLLRLTVTVRARNPEQIVVRASAQYALQAVEDPQPYRDFFQQLARTLRVEAGVERD
jgi:hypothetical protein